MSKLLCFLCLEGVCHFGNSDKENNCGFIAQKSTACQTDFLMYFLMFIFLNVFLQMCVQKIQEHVHFFPYILNVVLYRAYALYDMHCMYYNVQFCLSD